MLGSRSQWLETFETWLAARFRVEFSDVDWTFFVNFAAARASASPRGAEAPKVSVTLPADFERREPYAVAAQVAAELRKKAEEMGVVPRIRTQPPARGSDIDGDLTQLPS